MGLYLGDGGKRKVIIDGVVYCLNLFSIIPIINGIMLLSSDDYVLRDINGLYLTVEESD